MERVNVDGVSAVGAGAPQGSDYARWKGWRPDRFALVKARDARYFDWHVRRAMGADSGPLKVLEIGFGNGTFLGWARRRGHQIVGTEIDAGLCAVARAAGFAAAESVDALAHHGPWDLIAGFDVLEHVPAADLPTMLRSLAARLRPGGRLLFRFPNGESPFGLIRQYRDITHVNVLGVSRLRQVALPLGLEVVCSGDALPWYARRWRSVPTALVGSLLRAVLQWTLARLYLGQTADLQANEVVVLKRADEGSGAQSQ